MQTTRITLPEVDGAEQWAEIRDVSELRSGDVKAVRGAYSVTLGEDGKPVREFSMHSDFAQKDALLRRVIVNWSLDLPHPQADPAVLDQLPIPVYEALVEATKAHLEAVDFTGKKTKTSGGDSSD